MREEYSPAPPKGPAGHPWIERAIRLNATGRVVGWLFLFLMIYRLGLPVLYAAALAALPLLLLPAGPKGD